MTIPNDQSVSSAIFQHKPTALKLVVLNKKGGRSCGFMSAESRFKGDTVITALLSLCSTVKCCSGPGRVHRCLHSVILTDKLVGVFQASMESNGKHYLLGV